MKRCFCVVVMTLATLARAAAPPASAPTTLPASRTAEMEPLADGTVRYMPPPGWNLVGKTPNDLEATYKSPDESAAILITVLPQDRALHESSKGQMARIIDKGIREAAAREKLPIVVAPKQEDDPRFFLKMHDALRVEGKIADRIQMYRVIGLNLVHVAATANVDSLEQSRPALDAAEQMMATMRVSRGSKRVIYPHAQLRAVVPLDWTERRIDQANGAVATYADPKEPSRQLFLGARIIPKTAREDKTKLDALVALMVDQERALPARLAGQKSTEAEVPTTTYVRQTRLKLTDDKEGPVRVETRYLMVGDVLASVRYIARENDAEAMTAIAEKFAANLKPVKD